MKDLNDRLNKILERVTADDFLSGRGLGNEVPFHAFDYPPEAEEQVRQHIKFVLEQAPKRRPGLRIAHVNLFELALELLEERGLYQKAVDTQASKGNDALLRALKAPLSPKVVAKRLVANVSLEDVDCVFISAVGSAYPMIRTHNLLNNLQPLMGTTPLVVFYPGQYDGQSLRLFGRLADNPYYRAFRLVS